MRTEIAERLIPLWFTLVVVTSLVVFTTLFALVGVLASGPMATSMVTMAIATGATLVAAVSSLARRRPRKPLPPGPDGQVVVTSPLPITVGLLVAWAAVVVFAGQTVWIALTDFDEIEAPGMSLLVVVGTVGCIPDLLRLCTGRLHRWRLTLAPDGLTYRGYRTDVFTPWSRIRKVSVQRRGPAGVRVETRDGPVVVPAPAFTVPADQLIDEIRARVAQS